MLRGIRNTFITGFIILLPISLSLYILYVLFNFVDGLLKYPIEEIFRIKVPGIGLLATLVIVFVIGLIGKNYVGKKIIIWSEKLIRKIPLLRTVFVAIKQIVDTLSRKKNAGFKKVVLIEYPRKGISTIGFITAEAPKEVNHKTNSHCVSIFVPTTPNPTSGIFVMIPEEEVHYLKMTVEEAVKLIVSGGLVIPEDKKGGAANDQA